ncbi:hypothetical protein [Streptomyces sp. NBC_00354]|uniref:hypothetical protein n=1 Tax=Streptomyces sp. NBC_00354 TaxID=2975723 RepID=UPI002E27006F
MDVEPAGPDPDRPRVGVRLGRIRHGTATAKVRNVVWSMGDGAQVTCTGPGTPYAAEFGKQMAPDCGHMYTRTSAQAPGGRYAVTATTTWEISWAGGGQTGTLTAIRESATSLAIGELQVLNVP